MNGQSQKPMPPKDLALVPPVCLAMGHREVRSVPAHPLQLLRPDNGGTTLLYLSPRP